VIYPNSGVLPEHTSELTTFEAPDPRYWVPHGYAIVTADIPGTWYSRGRASYCPPEEARAFAALIGGAGTQEWSNGKVGLSGVSYLTTSQWQVAALNPPHLATINPWEGWNDTYREMVRHGGIPETWFWPHIQRRWGASVTEVEDLAAETEAPARADAPAGAAGEPGRVVRLEIEILPSGTRFGRGSGGCCCCRPGWEPV